MKLFLIRPGETDWKLVESRGVRGWATSFAPLTDIGRIQIDAIANDYRLAEAEAILCSSYARALESAARLSRKLNLPLYVEYDLHEWLPQKDSLGDIDRSLLQKANAELREEAKHAASPDAPPAVLTDASLAGIEDAPWETLQEVKERVTNVLKRYQHLSSVVVVTHAVVISSLVGVQRQIEHAEIVPFELDLDEPVITSAG